MTSISKEQPQGRFRIKNPFKRQKNEAEQAAEARRQLFQASLSRVSVGIDGPGTIDDCLTIYKLGGLDDLYGAGKQTERQKVIGLFQDRYQRLSKEDQDAIAVGIREQMPAHRVVSMLDEYYVGQARGQSIPWVDELLTTILATPDESIRDEYISSLKKAGNMFQSVVARAVDTSYERVHGKQDIYARFRE